MRVHAVVLNEQDAVGVAFGGLHSVLSEELLAGLALQGGEAKNPLGSWSMMICTELLQRLRAPSNRMIAGEVGVVVMRGGDDSAAVARAARSHAAPGLLIFSVQAVVFGQVFTAPPAYESEI